MRDIPGARVARSVVVDSENIRIFFTRAESNKLESKLFPWIKNGLTDTLKSDNVIPVNEITGKNDSAFEIVK